jgi:4-amino-4-deoxy-L-arabinose transferase-like glycosyltransferase
VRGVTPRRSPLLWLCLAALAVRVVLIVAEPPSRRVGDEGLWRAMGRELASPEVRFSPLRSRLITHPPLYPYLIGGLAAAFGSFQAVKWAQALLGVLLVPAVFRIGRLWYGPRAGLLAGALAAFDPVLVWQTTHFWSEVLFLAVLWWGFERVVESDRSGGWGAALAGGACWGLAILARETVLYFAPLVALWLAWRRPGGLRRAALFLLGCVLLIAPWAMRNRQVFGFAMPLATRGSLNLWKGNTDLPWTEVHRRYGLVEGELARERMAWREALREIVARQPGWVFRKTVTEIPELWGVNNLVVIHLENEAYGPLPGATVWTVSLVTIVPYVLLLALAAWGAAAVRAERLGVLFVGFLVLYTALHIVAFGFPRFRLPMMPVVFLLAAQGWRLLREGPPLGRSRRLAAAVLAVSVAAVVVQSAVQTFRHPVFGLVGGIGASARSDE